MGRTFHEMQDITAVKLSTDPIFQKYYESKPQLIVASHHEMRNPNNYSPLFRVILKSFTFGSFEDFPSISNRENQLIFDDWEDLLWKKTVIVPYVDVQPEVQINSPKTPYKDDEIRPIDLYFVGQYDLRPAYKTRRDLSEILKGQAFDDLKIIYAQQFGTDEEATRYQDYSKEACDVKACLKTFSCIDCAMPKDYMSNYAYTFFLSKAKFHIVPKGETPSNSRVYDSLSCGVIPIILSDYLSEVALPFKSVIPWEDLLTFVPMELSDPAMIKAFRHVLDTPEEILADKRRLIEIFKDDVSWTSENSRVVENIINEVLRKEI